MIPATGIFILKFIRKYYQGDFTIKKPDFWEISILFLSVLLIVSTIFGENPAPNLASAITFIFTLSWASYCRHSYNKIIKSNDVINAIWIMAFVQSFFAILQQLTGSEIGNFQSYFGDEVESGGDVFQAIISRVKGTLGHPNLVANWLVICLPFMLTTNPIIIKPISRIIRSIVIIMVFIAIAFTFSRASIGILFLLLIMLYGLYHLVKITLKISFKVNIVKLFILVSIFASSAYFIYQKKELIDRIVDLGYERISETFEGANTKTSGDFRMAMNYEGVRYMKGTLVLGIGYENSKLIWNDYESSIPSWWHHRPHNIFIIFGIEAGVIGLFFFTIIALTPLKRLLVSNWLNNSFSFSLTFAIIACLGFCQVYITPIAGEFAPIFFGLLGLAMGHLDHLKLSSLNDNLS